MTKRWHVSRRTVLKGLGTAIALPFLDSMMPALSFATQEAAKAAPPRRMAFFYVPNGVIPEEWFPKTIGRDFDLPNTLQPLAAFKDDMLVFTGLTCDKARANGDGPGDHARAMAAFLTGSQPRKTAGADIRAGVSVDQVAAQKIGSQTKFASLELGCDRGLNSGNCDSGYSCAYSANLSWRSESTPMAKEVDPKQVFERLFSSGSKGEAEESRARRERYNKSILDFVAEDASGLKQKLGATDQRKLDEYLTGVREIEQRISRVAKHGTEEAPEGAVKPTGIPQDFEQHIHLLGDLLVLAFQGDLSRVSTFVFANEGSNRNYRFIDVPDGHHDISHHGNNKEKVAKIAKINHFHMTQFAYIVGKMKAIKEGDGTMLDNCMLLYGSGNGDGNRHTHHNLPILLVGKGGGTITTGRHIRFKRDTPLTNLYLSMLDRMGAPIDRLGDSTGRVSSLSDSDEWFFPSLGV